MRHFICSNPDQHQQVKAGHIKVEEVKWSLKEEIQTRNHVLNSYNVEYEGSPAPKKTRMLPICQKEHEYQVKFSSGHEESKRVQLSMV